MTPAARLRETWEERDRRFAIGRRVLTDAEIESVRDWRSAEAVEALDEKRVIEARLWTPPPLAWVR